MTGGSAGGPWILNFGQPATTSETYGTVAFRVGFLVRLARWSCLRAERPALVRLNTLDHDCLPHHPQTRNGRTSSSG
jgi:hypothetical protein